MKRLSTVGVLLSCLWLLLAGQPTLAQEKAPSEGKMAAWRTLKPGLQVLRLWESVGPQWPQIAVLKLSRDVYKEFRRSPKAFVNEYKIFPEAVKRISACPWPVAYSKKAGNPGDDDWIVMIPHMQDSTSMYTSLEGQ